SHHLGHEHAEDERPATAARDPHLQADLAHAVHDPDRQPRPRGAGRGPQARPQQLPDQAVQPRPAAPRAGGHRRQAALTAGEEIREVLARIRAELEDIAGRIDRNQAAIARATWAAGASDADYVRAMQDADLSAQRIAGLAGYLRALGEAADPRWRLDPAAAAATLTLAGMARTVGARDMQPSTQAAGDVDLF